jgi:RNAse (barnase) inhibitor barstar
MPWLGRGFVHCVHADVEQVLRQQLAGLGFTVFTIAGERIDDAQSLHVELARTFGFPDYYGANWDAFNDCFDDPELPHRSALLWRGVERLAASDLKAFAEAVVVLSEAAESVERDARQVALFLLGTGNGFRRPGDPVDPAWRRLPV